jgi:hypothetical protein
VYLEESDGMRVYSTTFPAELVMLPNAICKNGPQRTKLPLGTWINFTAREDHGIWKVFSYQTLENPIYNTLPCLGIVYLECRVSVPEKYVAGKGKLKSEIASQVIDDRNLLIGNEDHYEGTELCATLAYCHKQDFVGYWRLECIQRIFSY